MNAVLNFTVYILGFKIKFLFVYFLLFFFLNSGEYYGEQMHPNLDIHFSLDPIDQTLTCKYRVFLNPTSMGIKEWKGGFTVDHCVVDSKYEKAEDTRNVCKTLVMDSSYSACFEEKYKKYCNDKMFKELPKISRDFFESQQLEAVSSTLPGGKFEQT